ncbi:hypothetical protein ACXWTF_12595 [Thiomicrolovo sp. ZZH C-3]
MTNPHNLRLLQTETNSYNAQLATQEVHMNSAAKKTRGKKRKVVHSEERQKRKLIDKISSTAFSSEDLYIINEIIERYSVGGRYVDLAVLRNLHLAQIGKDINAALAHIDDAIRDGEITENIRVSVEDARAMAQQAEGIVKRLGGGASE